MILSKVSRTNSNVSHSLPKNLKTVSSAAISLRQSYNIAINPSKVYTRAFQIVHSPGGEWVNGVHKAMMCLTWARAKEVDRCVERSSLPYFLVYSFLATIYSFYDVVVLWPNWPTFNTSPFSLGWSTGRKRSQNCATGNSSALIFGGVKGFLKQNGEQVECVFGEAPVKDLHNCSDKTTLK